MSNQKFELYLSRAEKSVKGVAVNYRKAAIIALIEFEKSGNLSLCQRIMDSMKHTERAGVVKRSGFVTWLFTFSPATWGLNDKGKPDLKSFVKDKGDNAVGFDVPGALRTDFWTLSANNDEEVLFTGEAVWEAVVRVVKKFKRENHKADDPSGTKAISDLEAVVKKHAPSLA